MAPPRICNHRVVGILMGISTPMKPSILVIQNQQSSHFYITPFDSVAPWYFYSYTAHSCSILNVLALEIIEIRIRYIKGKKLENRLPPGTVQYLLSQ